MATTEEFKNGGSTSYPFTIEYIKAEDIKIKVDGTALTYTTNASPASGQYKVVSTTATLGATAAAGSGNVHIYRETDLDTAAAVFAAGSSIRAADLNACHDLVRLASQEQNQKLNVSNISDNSIPASKLITGTLDSRYYTETESEALFLRQDSSENIASGDLWSNTDTKVATTAAIDARIIDLVDDVGGFVPVANETSFPAANPDVNNGNGTVVSVKAVSTTLTHNSGSVTIANGAGSGNTVTLTGVTENIPSGFGMILETTSTLHTYVFHRLTAPATAVHNISSNISNINAVHANAANINAAASNTTNITDVANNSANINTVAGQITLAEDLGLITGSLTEYTGNDINTVADNIQDIKDVADTLTGSGAFAVDQSAKTTGSVVYYDGTKFKADTTTTKSSLVTGGNF